MRVEAKHTHGQIALEITAENANDRALLGLFDTMNNKRRIACTSTYSSDVSAVTQLYLYGMDMNPPAPSCSPTQIKIADNSWNAAIDAALASISGAPLFPIVKDYSPRDDAKMLTAMDILDKHIRKLKR